MTQIELVLTFLSLAIWVGLLNGRGGFWRIDQVLQGVGSREELLRCVGQERCRMWRWGNVGVGDGEATPLSSLSPLPRIYAVIPARNEADLLPVTMRSLLNQDYPGSLTVFLVGLVLGLVTLNY